MRLLCTGGGFGDKGKGMEGLSEENSDTGKRGTDFRPVFRYVKELQQKGKLKNLKALLYYTDGDGIYPREKTDYKTVFLLTRKPPKEAKIPAWAQLMYMDERKQVVSTEL